MADAFSRLTGLRPTDQTPADITKRYTEAVRQGADERYSDDARQMAERGLGLGDVEGHVAKENERLYQEAVTREQSMTEETAQAMLEDDTKPRESQMERHIEVFRDELYKMRDNCDKHIANANAELKYWISERRVIDLFLAEDQRPETRNLPGMT